MHLTYLGHAGFIVESAGVRILIDPWFYPGFLRSWFPYPDNRFLIERVLSCKFDYLYISHLHEDHFDAGLLARLDRDIRVICPDYRSRAEERRLRSMGFRDLTLLGHRQSSTLAPGLVATMYLDTSHKEDSGLLLEHDGFRFLDLNDCNTNLSDLPDRVDVLAAQYSGAMWYPNCYDYDSRLMQKKVDQVRDQLMETLVRKCEVSQARAYVPSAGPACFLDPALMPYNNRDETIFPIWEDVHDLFQALCPETEVVRIQPGDEMQIADRRWTVEPYGGARPSSDLTEYSNRRRGEWVEFYDGPEPEITSTEITKYFAKLQRINRHLVHDFTKHIRLAAGGQAWGVTLGKIAEDFVIEGEEPYSPEYVLTMSPRVLRAVLSGETGWEEALLSMRIRLHREPDIFDSKFMGLLRYGNQPIQTLQMARESHCADTIERDGLRIQRYCPHAGEDLVHATICDGVIECPRHHWRWSVATGECLEGGSIALKVEPLEESSMEPTPDPQTAATAVVHPDAAIGPI